MEKEKNKGKREERKGNESHDQPNHPRSPLRFRPPVISTAKLRDSPSTSVRTNGRVDMVENDPRDSLHLSLSLYPLPPSPHLLPALLFRLPFNPVATNSKRGRFRIRGKVRWTKLDFALIN